MIPPELIDSLCEAFENNDQLQMATAKTLMDASEYDDPNAVKVVTDQSGYAIYFSRSLIPYPRHKTPEFKVYKHIGIYAYRRDFLLKFAALLPTPLEQIEGLEQLRALETGAKIKVLTTDFKGIGIDTQEDLDRANKVFELEEERNVRKKRHELPRKESNMKTVAIGNYKVGAGHPLLVMAGPCVLEGYERSLMIGRRAKAICEKVGLPYVFKASFDKANRSSLTAFRGPGLEEGLEILKQIKKDLGVPVVSDVHETYQVEKAAEVLDIIQIPAFLCRQTDLLVAAAHTGRVVNVKKGQFLAPWDMKNVINKLVGSGTEKIMLTERGASFGYNTLVTDMRSLPIMRDFGYPVIMDVTHSVQIPGGKGTSSGGQSQYAPISARAAAAVGVDGLFMEVHDNPAEALSDGPNMIALDKMEQVLLDAKAIDAIGRRE